MKTVNEIYSLTKGLMFEKPSSTIYDNYLIHNLNQVLAELFKENNMERMFNGKAPLDSVPYVSLLTDEVPYEDVYVNNIIPLGLATLFFIDDDLNKFNLFNVRYNNARVANQKLLTEEEIDAITTATDVLSN